MNEEGEVGVRLREDLEEMIIGEGIDPEVHYPYPPSIISSILSVLSVCAGVIMILYNPLSET